MRSRPIDPAPPGSRFDVSRRRSDHRRQPTARRLATLITTAGLLAASALTSPAPAAAEEPVAGYLVTLRPQTALVDAVAGRLTELVGGRVTATYSSALRGFSARLTRGQAAALARQDGVVAVEQDAATRLAAQDPPEGLDRISDPGTAESLAASLDVDGLDDVRVNADVAVLDTGIDGGHPDLDVRGAVDCVSGSCAASAATDGNGHGTHVAGTTAALDNGLGVVGVAPGARLWQVRVLASNGNGTLSALVAGLDWVTARADTIDVANLSLGCFCTSTAVTAAVKGAVAAGITVVAAAGNHGVDGSGFLPANLPETLSVAALTDFDGVSGGLGSPTCRSGADDTSADYSNYGSTVDLRAPGTCIRSTWPGGGYATLSGTSMAAPQVAGAVALLASRPEHRGEPSAIRAALLAAANTDYVSTTPEPAPVPLLDTTPFVPTLDPAAPPLQLTVNDVTTLRPAPGTTGTARFRVQLSAPVPDGMRVRAVATTADGTGKHASGDYTQLPSAGLPIVLAPGETSREIAVTIGPGSTPADSRTFTLSLAKAEGAVLADKSGTATLTDPAGLPRVLVSDAQVAVPAGGTASATFRLTLTHPVTTGTATVAVSTADGTAKAGTDYDALPSTVVSFAPGQTTAEVPVTVRAPDSAQGEPTFTLRLGTAVGAVVADSTGTGTVLAPVGLPRASVSDAWVAEGADGTTSATFTVSLTRPVSPGRTASVTVSTANGTARGGVDYTTLPTTTITFAAGERVTSVPVTVLGNLASQPDRTFTLRTGTAVGLVVADSIGTGTIADDDGKAPRPAPAWLAADDVRALEPPDGASSSVPVAVHLAAPLPSDTTFRAVTVDGTAKAGVDFVALPLTTFTVPAGTSSVDVPITLLGNDAVSGLRTFTVALSSPSAGAVLADSSAVVTVVDPKGMLQVAAAEVRVLEGDTGTTTVQLPLTLSAPPAVGQVVSVLLTPTSSTAQLGLDTDPIAPLRVTFAAGQTTALVPIRVRGDLDREATTESVLLALSAPVGAVVSDTGALTLVDEEGPVQAALADPGSLEASPVPVTVVLDAPAPQAVVLTVSTTTGGTATPGTDYAPLTGVTLTIPAGALTGTLLLTVVDDALVESHESVNLAVSAASPAVRVVDGTAVATLLGDD